MSQPGSELPGLYGFCSRLLGWSDECRETVDQAIRSIHLSVTHRAALVLLGGSDLVPVAHSLHRKTLGKEQPFIVCDPRRQRVDASVRAPTNYESCVAAVQAARGGSLCVQHARMPPDLPSALPLVRDPNSSVQLIICAKWRRETDPFLVRPAPIRIPSPIARGNELPRVIDEYARDAIDALHADDGCFTDVDRRWVLDRAASTFEEIEKATLRLVALKMSQSVVAAAKLLGMSYVALGHWIGRRRRVGRRAHSLASRRTASSNLVSSTQSRR